MVSKVDNPIEVEQEVVGTLFQALCDTTSDSVRLRFAELLVVESRRLLAMLERWGKNV